MATAFNRLETAYLASACLDAEAEPARAPREVYRDVALRYRGAGAGPVSARAVAKAVEEGVLPRRTGPSHALDAAAVLYLATVAQWTGVQLKKEAKTRLFRSWRELLRTGAQQGDGASPVVELDRHLLFDPRPAAARWQGLIETYAADRDRYIELDPDRMGGVPVIRGTRLPVRSILARHDGGDPVGEIADDYPDVPEAALAAAVAYARTHPPQGRPQGRSKRLR